MTKYYGEPFTLSVSLVCLSFPIAKNPTIRPIPIAKNPTMRPIPIVKNPTVRPIFQIHTNIVPKNKLATTKPIERTGVCPTAQSSRRLSNSSIVPTVGLLTALPSSDPPCATTLHLQRAGCIASINVPASSRMTQ